MKNNSNDTGIQFLTVGEAAKKLGVSRIKLREAVALGRIPGRRDNEGSLRVDLSKISGVRAKGAVLNGTTSIPPEEILDLLFDEVEESQQNLDSSDARIEALSDLVLRQGEALDHADAALTDAKANEEKLSTLLDKSFVLLEIQTASSEKLRDVSDRAFDMLDDSGDRLEASLAQASQFEKLLERAMMLVEAAGTADGDRAAAMTDAADRAMQLLDRALADAEDSQGAVIVADKMLERAIATGERLEGEVSSRDETIKRQKTLVERILAMSERAVGLVPRDQARSGGFFDWLNGKTKD